MKHPRCFFNIFLLIALLAVALGLPTGPASAEGESFVCLPTCNTTDGRMFTISGVGNITLAGQTNYIKIAAPASMTSFQIGLFDGETSGVWDKGTVQLVYTLFADPTGSQTGTVQLAQWPNATTTFADNAWTDLSINQDVRAQAPSGDYFYYLKAELPGSASTTTISSFKIRSNSLLELATNKSFAYMVPLKDLNEAKIIYPQLPALSPTTYDGTWDMYLHIPTSQPFFAIWDGDVDYGSYDCSLNDTEDSDTPDGVLPSFAIGISDNLEGVATTTKKCATAAGQVITGPDGQIYSTGDPSDDYRVVIFRREPAVTYDVIDPNGNVYHNDNPSGNQEWEQFRIDSDPKTPADYHVNGWLPAGIYKVHVTGLDLDNLNAWHIPYDSICVHEDGTPCVPVLKPFKLGDTIWNDLNGNSVQDEGEAGLPGVTVTLLDANGQPLPNGTAVTDANGQYAFKVGAGDYSVQVDPSNFEVGGALAGYLSTTGGELLTNTVTTDNVLIYDFGYQQLATLGDKVWNDLNGNGLQDEGEPGLEGVTVNLLVSDGLTIVATQTTAADGSYSFTNLVPGAYSVQFVTPAGYNFTVQNAGGSTAETDSNVDPLTGVTGVITLVPGLNDTTVDAGLQLARVINYCGYIRSPGFWKNYKNHMSSEAFLSLISNTQDFSYLTAKQALAIISKNNGKTKMGIPELDGVDARYLKFLLVSQINAVWNGQPSTPAVDGIFGSGTYLGTDLMVNQLLHETYLDRWNFSSEHDNYLQYLGAGGENDNESSCLVQP